jgi:hypothetical protein
MTVAELYIWVVGTIDVIGIIFCIWLNTKAGKRWMKNLG